jgi:putative transport protein
VADSIRGGTLLPVLVAGLAVALIPPLVGYGVGLRALKLNPSVLLGAICGARCNTAGLKVAQEEAHSAVPAIGFAVPTALGTVLVTIAAYLMTVV